MMRFLGTGAAETLPNPFCDCPVCAGIRRDGHLYHKNRSCFQVSNQMMIDFGPDVIAAAHTYDIDFCSLRHILFTHTHDDHISFGNLSLLGMSRRVSTEPVELYFSPQAYAWVCNNIAAFHPAFTLTQQEHGSARLEFSNKNAYRMHSIPCDVWLQIGDCRVKALRSSHRAWAENEWAWNYLIELPDHRKLFYACDTGRIPPETLEALAGEAIDILVMECTFGSQKMEATCGHLDAYAFLEMLHIFEEKKFCAIKRRFSQHISIISTRLRR